MQYFLERMALDHDPRNLIPDDYLRVSGYTIIPPQKQGHLCPYRLLRGHRGQGGIQVYNANLLSINPIQSQTTSSL